MKRIRMEVCAQCGLAMTRRNVVPGRGELPCDLLIIGEAPGVTEDMTGQSFIGLAGQLLDRMEKASGLAEFRIYRTNCVLCRPCDDWRAKNRQPTPEEVLACLANVNTLIRLARPRVALLLGRVSRTYFSKDFAVYFTAIHPSALLQSGSEESPHYLGAMQRFGTVYRKLKEVCYGL